MAVRGVRIVPAQFEEWQIELHGRTVVYRVAGSGPPVVLIHGMLNSSSHWQRVASALAPDYTVVAPDLIGHGDSAAPRGDYSLGAHAASIRDLLAAIGIERATIVGHSLGGGVAMQFFYQFPQRVERLALISSGGLGRDVSPLLRTAALPGVSALLSLTIRPRMLEGLSGGGRRMRERGVGAGVYLQAIARALIPLQSAEARHAFLHTLRAVIDVHGQRVSASDRLYLLEALPTLILWGERDNTIPIEHGSTAARAIPGSTFATIPRAAHFPHLEEPDAVAERLREFIATTEPGELADADWAALLARRSPRSRRLGDAA
ncbi:MAG TPA: alpha/beta fold hydrolase [Solirubrobacteraceae bacterium]|nr:alpha/beta fold hydrolase [Solirubrobacteraceae bacterium]